MSSVPSLLVCIGKKYYKLYEVIREYKNDGISKRSPRKSVPRGLDKCLSKIFCAHPDAIIKVTTEGQTLHDLAYTLLTEGFLTEDQWDKLVELEKPYWTGEELQAGDFVPEGMLDITEAFSRLPDKRQAELTKELGLVFCMGVFGYAPFEGFQVVLRHDETELSEDLEDLQPLVDMGYVEPVHVHYTDDTDGAPEDEDETE